jgi:hypothetical protein
MKKLIYTINGKVVETIATGPAALIFWMKKQKQLSGQYNAGKLKVINI